MRIAIVVLVAALAGACATPPAPTGAQTAATNSPTAKAAVAKEDRVCKRSTPTGSNMPQNVCRSKAEWAAIEERDREKSDALSRQMREGAASPH